MRPLNAKRPDRAAGGARGPGPSRLAYRLNRLWKKNWVRRVCLWLVPAAVVGAAGAMIATDERVSSALAAEKEALMAQLSTRPEFSVRGVQVRGAAEALTRQIEEMVPLDGGLSSLTLDVAALQRRIAELGAVKAAHVALLPTGTLQIAVTERHPVALWRDGAGRLWKVDAEGVAIARAATRAGYPDLPLLLGDGAPHAAAEALEIVAAIPDLRPRIRALIRVGGRRWNVALAPDLTVMLPEDQALAALDRVVAWHYSEELLDRDVAVVDVRLPDRPVIRMTEEAAALYRLRQAARGIAGEDT